MMNWTLLAIVDPVIQRAADKRTEQRQQQHPVAVVSYVFVVVEMPQRQVATMMSPQNVVAVALRICDSLPRAYYVTFAH